MAEEPQVMNGPAEGMGGKYIDTIDPEDPEYVRQLRRPAEVKEDVRGMEDRKRVSLILNSQAFREELEQLVNEQIRTGPHPASLLALQQISELILPQSKFNQSSMFSRGSAIPIADIRGVDSLNYSKGEKMLRCKVAAAYRLVDLFGWSTNMQSLITTRTGMDHEHFLVAPHGMLYYEVTAAALAKVDMQGETLDAGATTLAVNRNAFALHSTIHAARPDIRSVIHLRNPTAVSISVMNCGLLPLCQEAMACGEVSCFDYSGALSDQEEKDKLARALGPSNKVLFLRHFGILVGGESTEEAFQRAQDVMTACDTQLRTLPVGLENIVLPSDEARKRACDTAHVVPVGEDGKKRWRKGEMEFEAHMRQLDNAGYRTGHIYREQLQKRDPRRDRVNSEVEIPPASSSFTYIMEEGDGKYSSPLKQHMARQQKQFKSKWLNSPNTYKKEEIEETGTANPKKITRWVSDEGGQQGDRPVKIDNANQFNPQGEDPKELKDKYKAIRKEYYEEKVTAGPQSRILEGMTWEEAQKVKDGHVSGTSDSVIVVGAASKGIIQRDHQHNATIYKTYYAPNPFDNMSPEEIELYKKEVETKGGAGDEVAGDDMIVPGPDGRLISTEERMQHVRSGAPEMVVSDVNGEGHPAGSPAKSTSSGEGTLEERSSREGSPTKEVAAEMESPEKGDKKKKKKKFRMPSFSKTKKEEKKA